MSNPKPSASPASFKNLPKASVKKSQNCEIFFWGYDRRTIARAEFTGMRGTQETTAMLFAYTNATLLLKWSKERSDV